MMNWHEHQGVPLGSSPLRSDGSHDSQVGRLDRVAVVKATQLEPSGSSLPRSEGSCDDQAGRLDA
jgi:hypothetical protein